MPATAVTYFDTLASPLGDLLLTSDGEVLIGVQMATQPSDEMVRDRATLKPAVAQLRAYLAGELKAFDLVYRQTGTAFQERVWAELPRIPYGTTVTYADVAIRIKQPKAARAVGSANGRNRIGIIVPCHRVVAAGGALGGYDWGLWRKEWLLTLEQNNS